MKLRHQLVTLSLGLSLLLILILGCLLAPSCATCWRTT